MIELPQNQIRVRFRFGVRFGFGFGAYVKAPIGFKAFQFFGSVRFRCVYEMAFTRATNCSAGDKGGQLYTLACLVKYAAGDLLHFTYLDRC